MFLTFSAVAAALLLPYLARTRTCKMRFFTRIRREFQGQLLLLSRTCVQARLWFYSSCPMSAATLRLQNTAGRLCCFPVRTCLQAVLWFSSECSLQCCDCKTLQPVFAMASGDEEPKLPLGPWLFSQLSNNPPNADLDIIESKLKNILGETVYCLQKIQEERVRRNQSAAIARAAVARVKKSNIFF